MEYIKETEEKKLFIHLKKSAYWLRPNLVYKCRVHCYLKN